MMKSKSCRAALVGLVIGLLFVFGGGPAGAEVLLNTGNIYGVENMPALWPELTLTQAYRINAIQHYHYNSGQGAPFGTISIYRWDDDALMGSWTASGSVNWGDPTPDPTQTRYWTVYPDVVLQPGHYYIEDSDWSTWSTNIQSGYVGFCWVDGTRSDSGGGDEEGTTVGPEGGSISTGQATVTVPAGAVPSSAVLSLTEKAGLTGYTEAAVGSSYQLTYSAEAINGDLSVQVSLPAGATSSLKLAVSENGAGRYSTADEASINFLDAAVAGSILSAKLPLNYGETQTTASEAGTDGVAGGTVELQPIYMLESRSQPFVLNYPHTWPAAENRPSQLLAAAQDAVTKLRNLGYSQVDNIGAPDDSRIRWFPLNVSQSMSPTKWAEQALTKSGEDYMYVDINNTYCGSANLATMRIQMGHEIFHAVQELMDPRGTLATLTDQKTLLWLKEASSVWFEYEMSGQGKSYMPDSHGSWNAYAVKGLEMGATNAEAQNIGYWASNFLRYLTDRYGDEVLFNTWQSVIAQDGDPYSGLAALINALGGATQAAYRFADFAGLWLFGQTDYGWQEPEPTGSFSASSDSTPTTFSGTSYPYSCEKYQFIFGSAASGKEYTISVDQGLGSNGMLFQLYSKAAGSGRAQFVQNLNGSFSFTSAGTEVYWVAVINGDPSRTTATAYQISVEEQGSTCQPTVNWNTSGSAIYIHSEGGPSAGFHNGPEVTAPANCCWQASIDADWLVLTSPGGAGGSFDPATGRGCGTVYFMFGAYCNCSQSDRFTEVTIAGKKKYVIQYGQTSTQYYCPYPGYQCK